MNVDVIMCDTRDNIADLIDEWRQSDTELELHEFLGLGQEEYSQWLTESSKLIKEPHE